MIGLGVKVSMVGALVFAGAVVVVSLATADSEPAMVGFGHDAIDELDGPRSPANEGRLRPVLDKIFEVHGHRPYELTCDSTHCVIEVDRDEAPGDWWRRVQDAPAAWGMFTSMRFEGDHVVVVGLEEPGVTAGFQAFARVHEAFEHSPELATCKRLHAARGRLRFDLVPDPARRTWRADAKGSLASSELATCAQRVLDSMLQPGAIPRDATWAPNWDVHVRDDRE